MIRLRILLSKFCGLFRKARMEQQLDEEVRAHLQMLAEENLRKGMNPEEARYAARRKSIPWWRCDTSEAGSPRRAWIWEVRPHSETHRQHCREERSTFWKSE